MDLRHAGRRRRQVQLDNFGRAGPDQEKKLDIWTPREEPLDRFVQLFIHIGQPGEIALIHDRGCESGLCKNHHPGRGLDQMGAGPRPDNQKKRILNLAVQPDNTRKAAEYLALPVLLDHLEAGIVRHDPGRQVDRVHSAAPIKLDADSPPGLRAARIL